MKFSDIFRNESVIMALLFGLMILVWNFCESVGIDSEWTALIIPISLLLLIGCAFIKGIFIIVRSMYLKHRPKNSSNPTYIKTMKKNTLEELKEYDMSYELSVENVYGTKDKLLIVAVSNIVDKNYTFISLYNGNGEEFMNKTNEIEDFNIKTWIDFGNPKVFEFDIEDLINKVDGEYSFILDDKWVIDDSKKAVKKIEDLKENI